MTASVLNSNDRPLLGVMLMITGMLFLPTLDICAKLLSDQFHLLQITWSRFAFNLLWLLPILLISPEKWSQWPRNPWIQLARGLCLLMATLFFFQCIRTNPIPNALGLLFISPLIVTVLSPLVLGENFGIKRFIATIAGFVGVLIVIQPTSSEFQPSLLYALLAGLSYAFYILITRKVSTSSSPLMTLFYTALVGTMVLLPWMPGVWVNPDSEALMIMLAMGLIAATGHYLVILSCRYAPASLVSPFNYVEIIGATLLSFLFFDYFPTYTVWIGITIICASGIYISMRELNATSLSVVRDQH